MKKKGLRITILLLVFTVFLLLGVRWAERDNRLNLTMVRIDNSSLVDSAVIAEELRPYLGRSLLKINTDSLEAVLLTLGGVDSVSVRIEYPETIIVLFSTRAPAVLLAYSSGTVPVTRSGHVLPVSWGNDQLPVIRITGTPDERVIRSALDLFIKYEFSHFVSMSVSNNAIVLVENGTRIILDPDQATENWLSWQSIREIIGHRIDEVDLRYGGQAVLRSTEET